MNIEISPKKVLYRLLILISTLLFLNIIGIIAQHSINNSIPNLLIFLFDFNTERNIPTFYSALALITTSLILYIIMRNSKYLNNNRIYWKGLVYVFMYLAIDEMVSIHEYLGKPLGDLLNTSGLLYYGWIIPYGIILLIFSTMYLNFLRKLPKNIIKLFILSAVIFIIGGIGFELVAGQQIELYGNNSITHSVLYTFEESFEMLGVALFIYALLLYISDNIKNINITFKEEIG